MSKPGRNDPCPCGSGKKYKHCCLLNPKAPVVDPDLTRIAPSSWNPDTLPPDQLLLDDASWENDYSDLPPLEAAYAMSLDGWQSPENERPEIAREALTLSPDCIEAYLLWASSVTSPEEALALYDQAIAAAERDLGADWETRYPTRAWTDSDAVNAAHDAKRDRGLALVAVGRTDEGIDLLQKVLVADPIDEEGVRYALLREFLLQGRERESLDLINQMPDLFGSIGLYMRALLKYRNRGDTFWPRRAIISAFGYDATTAAILADTESDPDLINPATLLALGSDADETAEYLKPFWEQTPGALDWLATIFAAGPDAKLDALPRGNGPALNIALSDAEGFVRCPRCHQKTKLHKRDIVTLFEPDHVDLVQLTTRTCDTCNILCLLSRDVIKAAERQAKRLGLNRYEHDFVTIGVIDPAFYQHQYATPDERTAAMGQYLQGWSDEIIPIPDADFELPDSLQELDDILSLARATGLLEELAMNPPTSDRPTMKRRKRR